MSDFLISVSCIVENDDGKILMVQEGKEHVRGKWDFPGGAMEEGETIEECAKREVVEETGFEIEFLGLIGIYFGKSQRIGQPSIDFLIESKIIGEAEKDMDFDDEILDEKFFKLEEIEKLDLRKENRYQMLEDFEDGQEIDIENIDYSTSFT